MDCNTGAIVKKVRNNARPMSTVFGGTCGEPSALLVKESTMIMRVKEVSIISSAGASESTVSINSI